MEGTTEAVGGGVPTNLDLDQAALGTQYTEEHQQNSICPRLCCFGEQPNNFNMDMLMPQDGRALASGGGTSGSKRPASHSHIRSYFCCSNSVMHSTNKEIQIYCMQSDRRKATKALHCHEVRGERVCLRNDLLIFNDLNMSEEALIQVEVRENAPPKVRGS